MAGSSVDDGDHELIAAAQRGERTALDAFVRRHDAWVRRVVYATVGHTGQAEDIVQHVWTLVWQQIGTLLDRSRWRAWIYRLAKNAAIDAGQKAARRRRKAAPMKAAEAAVSAASDPAAVLIRSEEHRRVMEVIRGLPEIYREPFVLRHLEDWSYAQIGEALSLPVDTVETRLVRARRLLRAELGSTLGKIGQA